MQPIKSENSIMLMTYYALFLLNFNPVKGQQLMKIRNEYIADWMKIKVFKRKLLFSAFVNHTNTTNLTRQKMLRNGCFAFSNITLNGQLRKKIHIVMEWLASSISLWCWSVPHQLKAVRSAWSLPSVKPKTSKGPVIN